MSNKLGSNIGAEIATVLGLKHCRKIVLEFEVGQIAIVTAEIFPEEHGIQQIIPILKKYRLAEIEEGEK